jgi:hypothetical protein
MSKAKVTFKSHGTALFEGLAALGWELSSPGLKIRHATINLLEYRASRIVGRIRGLRPLAHQRHARDQGLASARASGRAVRANQGDSFWRARVSAPGIAGPGPSGIA